MLLYTAKEPTDFESYQEQGDVGFTDVAGAQIDTFMYEDLSNSRERNLDAELWKEVYKVHDLAPEMFGPKSVPKTNPNAPKILQQAWDDTAQAENAARLSDWESMIEPNLEALKSRFPEANIRNRDEIDADIASEAKVLRDKFEKTYSYADPYAGFFGTLGGAAVASMADPINMMTLPLGGGKVAGASFIKGMGIVVARNFGIGFATEAALQPFVYDYKKEIESPYDLQEALFNMAAAGVGNGLLSGAGHAIGRGFDKIVGKQELPDTHETRKLRKDIQALLELQTFADETGAKTVGELEIHLKALNTAMADIEAGRQVDYDLLGKTIEAEYLELFDLEVDGARATMDYIAQKRYQLEESFDPDLYAKQEQLQKFADQKLTKWELKQAQNKADVETTGELNQETDLDAVREIQKAEFDKSVGEDTIRQNEEANIANNDLRASRRDEGDMIALKQQMDDLDTQYSDQVDYHSAAKKARDQYVVDKAEETNQAIAVAPTDTPRMMAVKTAVNRIAASMGANDIKVRVYEGNPELDGDMRFSIDDGEGSAAWKAAEDKGLDMSQEGRMARAKAMGFDTETVYYHGASRGGYNRTSDIEAFDPEKIGDKWGQDREGFFFTTNKNEAGYYATTDSIGNNVSGGTIYPIYHRSENPFIIDSKNDVDLAGEGGVPYWDNNHIELIKAAKKGGHDSIRLIDRGAYENQLEEMLVLFDPSKIRSVNAAFDPDFIDSPNLRYSRVGDADVSANSVLQFTPFKAALDVAKKYMSSKGLKYTPPTKHVIANPERATLIAEEFERMKHDPSNPEVAAAYDAMINETNDQFKYILETGLKVEFIRGTDPYVNGPSDVIADVTENNHIWVYSTRDGFGSNDKFDPTDNPLLRETEFEIDGVKLLANDVFRIVHDYFGHIKTGTTFRATGEENAWQSHASMYTPVARRAMTTETRGQNSWVNYGPDGTINRTATTGDTTFADQKIGLLPRWVSEENRVSADDRKTRYESDRRNNTTGFEGAIDESGRVKLIHYSRKPISRTEPDRWGDGLSRNVRTERNRKLSGAPGRTYFGIEQATENGYKKELGLGDNKLETTIDGELLYNPVKNPEKLWDNNDIVSSERAIADAGYVGYYVNSKQLGKVVAVFDEVEVNKVSEMSRRSRSGDTIEAAINPETGELHINASAFRDEAHLMQVMREEIIGHYGLRKSLGNDFQGVINDIKSTALTNPELRQMWVDLSGIDPQTNQIINPNAPYKGMADDVIADEIISKMAREEISDTTFMTLKNIIIKALRKVGLIKDDITVSEMRALVVKSEQALKKNVVKQPRITGLKPQLKQVDEPLNNEAIDAESNRIVADEANDQVTFDQNGNSISLRASLMEDDADIAGIESIRVCML